MKKGLRVSIVLILVSDCMALLNQIGAFLTNIDV